MNDHILSAKKKVVLKIILDYSFFLRLKCAEKLYGINPQSLTKLALGDWLEGNDIPIVTEEDIQSIQEEI